MNFNTSHVTVYRPLQAHRFFHHTFQYIPCYGLSQCSALLRLLSAYFNTSHVTVYPMAKSLIHIIPTDFNTSHVTVYLYLQTQWIYGLVNFNTSHVTVYPFEWVDNASGSAFQYIPCYGLSCKGKNRLWWFWISIHPMLRFICTGYIQRNACYVISIHPMLRFITIPWKYAKLAERFQYIPCYGLSGTFHQIAAPAANFNTSHVTVYLMILSHFYLGIFHHFLYFTSFQHFLPADYKI